MYLSKFLRRKKSKESDRKKESIYDILERIKNGDSSLRNKLIIDYTPFILKVTVEMTGRYIDIKNDDEYSIALAAFDEAISSYDLGKNYNFILFSEQVIKRRLINYFRKVNSQKNTYPFSYFDESENFEEKFMTSDSHMRFEDIEKREEIEDIRRRLGEFDIKISDLITASPRHKDSMRLCIKIAKIIAEDDNLYNFLINKKSIPRNEILKRINIHRRTIENNRKYIIAACLILKSDYSISKSFLISAEEGVKYSE